MINAIWTTIAEVAGVMARIQGAVATFLYDHPAAIVVITFVLILGVVHWWTTPSWDPHQDDGHQETP